MAAHPLQISCPSCGSTLRPPLTDGGSEVDAGDTLLGREVTCRACDAEFEVLFYSR